MQSAARQGNRQAQQRLAELPTCPEAAVYLWEYFNDLDLTRDNYGWGPTRLKHREIEAWQNNRNVRLDRWELDALLSLDGIYLAVIAESKGSDNGG